MRVAYAGMPGAFSHEACLAFLPDYEAIAEPSFEAVIEAVTSGRSDLGVLPLENVAAGPVSGVAPLLDRSRIRLISEHLLPIRMHLLGLPGTTIERLTCVASHPIAFKQCIKALTRLGLPTEEAANTAVAAAELTDPAKAVLASEAAAAFYGLEILLRDVHDNADNATLFGVLAAF